MVRRFSRFWADAWGGKSEREVTSANLARTTAHLARLEMRDRETDPELNAGICTQRGCEGPAYRRFCAALGEPVRYQRKQWEQVFICHELEKHGCLTAGQRGLGFGVGTEPLPSLFAARGCHILATDQAEEAAEKSGWARSRYEHMNAKTDLNARGLCPSELFAERVTTRSADMNAVPSDISGYDFCWSACALEHLGSIDAGFDFVIAALACLRPGGIGVHTAEFNLSSNDRTVETGPTVLYRRGDFERFQARLAAEGHELEPMNFDNGEGLVDQFIDVPPFHPECHLRLQIQEFVCTSVGFVVRRAG